MSAAPALPPATVLRTALDMLAVPAVAVDMAGLVLDANTAGAAKLSVEPQTAQGRAAADVIPMLAAAIRLPLRGGAQGATLLVWPETGGVDAAAAEQQKADMLGRLAGGISHDLANPLGAILTLSSMIATEPGVPEDLQESAGLLKGEADRTLRLVRSALEFARKRPAARSRVALGPMVRECLELSASAMVSLDVRVSVSEVMPELEADAARLRQAILAILVAAVEAMGGTWTRGGPPATGALRIAGGLAEEDGQYRARISFDDTAPVVPEAARSTLFHGTGGRSSRDLAVAAALIEAAGGRLLYEPLANGNRLVLELPLAGDPPLSRRVSAQAQTSAGERTGDQASGVIRGLRPAVQAGPAASGPASGAASGAASGPASGAASSPAFGAARERTGGGTALTVLVCDDEPSIRALLTRVITRGGHHAREASGGAEALAMLDEAPADLVMADQRMADMTGVDLYRAAVDRRPELATRFVLMSGDAGTPELVEFAAATGLQVIEKPFDLTVVKAMLERLAAG